MVLWRLPALFGRYAHAHERLTLSFAPLSSARVSERAFVEPNSAVLTDGRLEMAGRARGVEIVTLRFAGNERVALRPAGGKDDVFDWRLDLPWRQEIQDQPPPAELIQADGSAVHFDFPSRRLARMALMPGFLWRVISVIPAAIGWLRTHEPRYRSIVRHGLGLDSLPRFGPLDPAHLPADPEEVAGWKQALYRPTVTIVLPVYNAFDLLAPCLDRLRRYTDLPWRIVVVDDASPDPRVGPFLRNWVADIVDARLCRGAELVTLPENLGWSCLGSGRNWLAA